MYKNEINSKNEIISKDEINSKSEINSKNDINSFKRVRVCPWFSNHHITDSNHDLLFHFN